MLYLADVLAWLKSLGAPVGVQAWSMARLDATRQRSIGVYQRQVYDGAEVALGGQAQTKTHTKHVQVLIHWTKDARETEQAAQALHDALAASSQTLIGDMWGSYVELLQPEPVDLGADESGVYERTILIDIHYQQ